jgi:hypothetical protein
VIGTWRHFDATGALLATSRDETPSEWSSAFSDNSGGGTLLIVVPGADRIRHRIHVGTQNMERYQLDSFELDRERVYVQSWGYGGDHDTIYDAAGWQLEKIGDGWQAGDCKWGGKRKQIARDGDLARLHSLLYKDIKPYRGSSEGRPPCGERQPIAAARGQRIDALLASRDVVRAQAPKFVRDVVLDEVDTSSMDDDQRREHEDLVRLLRQHMTFYVEWPHVDGLFIDVFRTVPGHVVRLWSDQMMEHVVEE